MMSVSRTVAFSRMAMAIRWISHAGFRAKKAGEFLAKINGLQYILTQTANSEGRGRFDMTLARIDGTNENIEIRKIFCIGRNYADHARERE